MISPSSQLKSDTIDAVDSRRLQVFLEAAHTTSFTTAAQVLGMVPSAVSHAIKALEEDFQCALFKRHGPRVTLTKAGIRLLPLAEELLQRMASLREKISLLKTRSQQLRVMMPEMFCSFRLPNILPDFMECFPSAIFEIASGDCDSPDAVMALDELKVDVLISYSNHDSRHLMKREIFHESVGVYVAPFHSFSSFPPISAREFETEPLLVSDQMIPSLLRQNLDFSSASLRFWTMPSAQSIFELARAGQGVALLPTWVAQPSLIDGTLNQLNLPFATMTRTCSVYSSAKTEMGWSAEVFTSLVAMISEKEWA
ncbi:LysR family transcriptional regulator [soil metagenome]